MKLHCLNPRYSRTYCTRFFSNFLGCCGYGSKGNSVRSEQTSGGGGGTSADIGFLYYQIPRRDCVIIPGLYKTINSHRVEFSDICGNAGLGGANSAFTGNRRTGSFKTTTSNANLKTLCSK